MSSHLRIPKNHEELFCSIPRLQIIKRMEENVERFGRSAYQIASRDGVSFRSSCRKELLALTACHRCNEKTDFPGNKKIILSGHQPFFNYPGVWIKIFLLDSLAKESDALAINLEVDSDALGSANIPFPRRKNHVEIVGESLVSRHEKRALDFIPVPTIGEWDDFMNRITAHAETLPNPDILERIRGLGRIGAEAVKRGGNLAGFFTELRLRYEEPANLNYWTLSLSTACKTRSFLRFFVKIAGDARCFTKVYNSALADYRIRHKLRYKANPFPDLQIREGFFELPFWWVDETGYKKPVYVLPNPKKQETESANFTLLSEKGERWCFDTFAPEDIIEQLIEKSIRIRPKALALTMFFRLFFCDLFIHGIGGAKYDETADYIIKEYFGVTPPHYLAASLTLYPDLGIDGPPVGEAERLRKSLREMKFKPEKFVDTISEQKERSAFDNIFLKKKILLEDLRKGKRGKEISREINAVNETLFSFIEPAWQECHSKLDVYEKNKGEENALRFREYPFCLFNPLELSEISEKY